eukprot:Hpha_TRINITY_DN27061_c0_g1::TRINITY_DN27061_c0_g1_i1::g.33230::m.33230/K01081/E3.1.3.5; 5'-nucleotidase
MGDRLVARNKEELATKVKALRAAAEKGRLCIISDFDRTLTRCFLPSGGHSLSAYGVFENCATFSQHYQKRVGELKDKYYKIEIDPHLTVEEKLPHMHDWYKAAHDLLLDEEVLETSAAHAAEKCDSVALREGAAELLEKCQAKKIPVLVMSAGMGNVIVELLRKLLPFKMCESTGVIANWLKFNEQGRLCGYSEPLLHMYNKSLDNATDEVQEQIKACDCCLLLGDGIGDAEMGHGHDWDTVLRVGFLNEKVEERVEQYKAVFDAVLLGDAPMPNKEFIFEA